MICSDEVNFRENSGASKRCGKVLDVGYRVPVGYCVAIQCTVVAARSPVSWCLFRDHVEWRGPIAGGGLYDA